MAALPNSETGSTKAQPIAAPSIHFAAGPGGPVAKLQSEIESRLAPADIIPFPDTGRSERAKLEDALSMCVGYLSLAGFVSGLALLFVR